MTKDCAMEKCLADGEAMCKGVSCNGTRCHVGSSWVEGGTDWSTEVPQADCWAKPAPVAEKKFEPTPKPTPEPMPAPSAVPTAETTAEPTSIDTLVSNSSIAPSVVPTDATRTDGRVTVAAGCHTIRNKTECCSSFDGRVWSLSQAS